MADLQLVNLMIIDRVMSVPPATEIKDIGQQELQDEGNPGELIGYEGSARTVVEQWNSMIRWCEMSC